MGTIRIEFRTGGSAFEENPGHAIATLLREVAQDFEDGCHDNPRDGQETTKLYDLNGNACGSVTVTEPED